MIARCSSTARALRYTFFGGFRRLDHGVRERLQRERARDAGVALRAGPVDAQAVDAAGRAPLRPSVELVPREDRTASRFFPGATFAARRRRHRLQRHHAAHGRRLRRVRQRQDRAEGEPGKYLQGASVSNLAYGSNPALRIPGGDTTFGGTSRRRRTAAGPTTNGNFIPDCDLTNPLAQSPATRQHRHLRSDQQPAFGGTQLVGANFDPDLLSRLGRASVGLVVRRLGAAADLPACIGGSRLLPPHVHAVHDGRHGDRQPGGSPNDVAAFTLTAPSDSRLPGNGGYRSARSIT